MAYAALRCAITYHDNAIHTSPSKKRDLHLSPGHRTPPIARLVARRDAPAYSRHDSRRACGAGDGHIDTASAAAIRAAYIARFRRRAVYADAARRAYFHFAAGAEAADVACDGHAARRKLSPRGLAATFPDMHAPLPNAAA